MIFRNRAGTDAGAIRLVASGVELSVLALKLRSATCYDCRILI